MLTDGAGAVQYIQRRHCVKNHGYLLELAKLYISKTARICNVFSVSKALPNAPNTPKLIKLYQASAPMYGHALFTAQMGFKGNHQPLKDGVTKHRATHVHISPVHNLRSKTGHRLFWMLESGKKLVMENSLLLLCVALDSSYW